MCLKLSDSETVRFLELYELEPTLYNPISVHYRDRNLRAAAAERISINLNVPGFGPKEAVIKFKNLRSSYCQELKKIAESEKSDAIYKPTVVWFEQMNSFIRPYVQQRERHSNIPVQETATVTSQEIENINNETNKAPVAVQQPTSSSSALSSQKRKTSSYKTLRTPQRRKKTKHTSGSSEMSFMSKAMSKLQDITSRAAEVAGNREDCYDHFGRYVASMLRTIGPPEAFQLQKEMTEMLANQLCPTSPLNFPVRAILTPAEDDTTSNEDVFSAAMDDSAWS